jgi:ribonuclease HI
VPSFVCQTCGREFAVPESTLAKYPGWQPKRCLTCKSQVRPAPARTWGRRTGSASREENLSVAEVLAKYSAGPTDGVFTDGAAEPNPGPGGWGVVYVVGGSIVSERHGHEPHTTNNRMELRALIEGCALVPEGTKAVIYTDSQLCVNTITLWAKGWEARGWKRKGGEIKNIELVKELYALFARRSELELRWIQAHSGYRWNEYADALATAYRRSKL